MLNETLIFRFPRWGEAGRGLAAEARILQVIREHVTLPVPNPIYGDPEAEDPAQRFIGYPLIPGEPLWRETLETITGAEVVTRLATQLGVFMRELHGLPAAFLPELRKADGPDYWTALYASFQTELFPFMRPDARDGVTRHFESYLSESRHFAYTPVLRHGDFGFGNILYDARSRRITGVIDWSSAGLGDPAVDVSAITSSSAEFVRAIEAAYPVTEAMRQRITFYRGTYALQQALYALRGDDQESFADGIAQYI